MRVPTTALQGLTLLALTIPSAVALPRRIWPTPTLPADVPSATFASLFPPTNYSMPALARGILPRVASPVPRPPFFLPGQRVHTHPLVNANGHSTINTETPLRHHTTHVIDIHKNLPREASPMPRPHITSIILPREASPIPRPPLLQSNQRVPLPSLVNANGHTTTNTQAPFPNHTTSIILPRAASTMPRPLFFQGIYGHPLVDANHTTRVVDRDEILLHAPSPLPPQPFGKRVYRQEKQQQQQQPRQEQEQPQQPPLLPAGHVPGYPPAIIGKVPYPTVTDASSSYTFKLVYLTSPSTPNCNYNPTPAPVGRRCDYEDHEDFPTMPTPMPQTERATITITMTSTLTRMNVWTTTRENESAWA
ncbi:MAG: hypothetical protein M1834_001216 [Cirrosporium novae-zelandiae]|nr:MAG: hypothetical protein M1834_001216 [Cirrosporium novae-zelandiae]